MTEIKPSKQCFVTNKYNFVIIFMKSNAFTNLIEQRKK